jgi:hypothetical protein
MLEMTANPNAFRKFVQQFVPEGHRTIAQGFNAGWNESTESHPEGTAESPVLPTGLQPSLRDWIPRSLVPGVETPGYSHVVPPGREEH